MDRPPANALNPELVERLLAALETARMDGARAIVLTGRPGMFSGGLDVPELLPLDRRHIEAFWGLFFNLTRQLAASPVPVIAAVSGHAPAGGAVLALHCDWRIGVTDRYKIGLNEVQVGLPVPGTVLVALEEAVGRILRRRGGLGDDDPSRVVHGGEVGERAADVDADAVHGSAFARERFAARRLAGRAARAVTKPLVTSEARALASRFAGGP